MIFLLVLCSREDDSFNIIGKNVMEGIKQSYSFMWFKIYRLEIPFKGDNVKTLIKKSNCENLVLGLFHCRQDSPQTMLVLTNRYKYGPGYY